MARKPSHVQANMACMRPGFPNGKVDEFILLLPGISSAVVIVLANPTRMLVGSHESISAARNLFAVSRCQCAVF